MTLREASCLPRDTDAQIEKMRLDNMKIAILRAEKENLNKRERGEDQMVELLRRIIVDEVRRPL